MASLKDLRDRIGSVKSTQKITSAMKMVAAAKLRRAQEQAEAARPYAERMERMLSSLGSSVRGTPGISPLLAGTGSEQKQLIVLATADRGLCGGFNTNLVRQARTLIAELQSQGKDIQVMCVGRKGRDALRRELGPMIGETIEGIGRKAVSFEEADGIADRLREMFAAGEFDVAHVDLCQIPVGNLQRLSAVQQLIPAPIPEVGDDSGEDLGGAVYEYEPSEEEILKDLLPRNISIQIYRGSVGKRSE